MGNHSMNFASFKLFFNKEKKVIRGNRRSSWWILFAMFLVTILSISYSKSSLTYLGEKMNDPFINWINVQNRNDAPINKLIIQFSNKERAKRIYQQYSIRNVEENFYRNYIFLNNVNKTITFEGRTIKTTSPILKRILSQDNLLEGRDIYTNPKSIGLIVTREMIQNMGYDSTPNFILMGFPFDTLKTDLVKQLGLITNLDYFGTPVPVVAVVKQLPGMMSFLCTEYFVQQKENQENTFDLTKTEYHTSLIYATSLNVNYKDKLREYLKSITKNHFEMDESIETNSLIDYKKLKITFTQEDSVLIDELGAISKKITSQFKNNLYRIYDYNTSDQIIKMQTDYLSIDFQRLDSIESFSKWANVESGVKIDMTQIDAKNNFNLISRLGNSLSIAIVLIAVAFIVIYLINLFRSHFEKVKRNIGTFKAFGLSNRSLLYVYISVLAYIVFTASFFAFLLSLVIQQLLTLFGVTNEGKPVLNVLSDVTLFSLLVTIMITLLAIFFTVKKLLKSTPGDLIYERD